MKFLAPTLLPLAAVVLLPHLLPGSAGKSTIAETHASVIPVPAPQDPSTQPASEPRAPSAPPVARPADVESPDALLAAIYDVISGPAGQARDWDRFRSLFAPEARLAAVGPIPGTDRAQLLVFTPDEYVQRSGPMLVGVGFYERELARTTEQFGHVLHAFSTYAGRRTADGEDVLRGVNSFQLVHDGQRWFVHSLVWEAESPTQPLPERYLESR